MKKSKNTYHHGNLAESLLDAVDDLATQFGLEAVTLRACAKRIGVSPSSAFRHYADKRTLLTAFATRALEQLSDALADASEKAAAQNNDAFEAVSITYIQFALDKPAFFKAMWREETIYSSDDNYRCAVNRLSAHLNSGFADTIQDSDPENLSSQELLAWSAVHGLASLYVDGPVSNAETKQQKLDRAKEVIKALAPALVTSD